MTNEERAETLIALLQDNYRYATTLDKINLVLAYADEIRRECAGKYESIFKWLLGEDGDFPESVPGHRYNWRGELRIRLAAIMGKEEGK